MSDENNNAPTGADGEGVPNNNQETVAYETYKKVLDQRKSDLTKLRELEGKQAEYEAAQVAKDNEDAKKRGEFEKLEQSLKAENAELKTKYEKLAINISLKSEFAKHNVAPPYLEAVTELFNAKGITLDKNNNALIGNVALGEAIADWAKSDAGKAFIAAPDSAGGGSNGSGTAVGKQTMKRSAFDALSPHDKAAAMQNATTLTKG